MLTSSATVTPTTAKTLRARERQPTLFFNAVNYDDLANHLLPAVSCYQLCESHSGNME